MTFVVDASVYNKLFLDEPGREAARNVIRNLIRDDATWFSPDLLRTEMCGTAIHYGIPMKVPLDILESHQKLGLVIETPPKHVWLLAEKIARSNDGGNGHPHLEDSLYHALAIDLGLEFLTADRRHVRRASQFGHLMLLDDVKFQ